MLGGLKIKIFADGADVATMSLLAQNPLVEGFTTNPTLMRRSGVADYKAFALDAIAAAEGRPVSFEVVSDEFDEMGRQARLISSWGPNVYVKVPVMNTRGESSADLLRSLSQDGIALNVTAVLSRRQVHEVVTALEGGTPAIVSVFAGRIADAGVDPAPLMREAVTMVRGQSGCELLWASPREVYNVCTAAEIGCDIITLTSELLRKVEGFGRDPEAISLETVQMFYDDATNAGYVL